MRRLTGFYYALFSHMKSVNILDPDDDVHLFSLHTVFLPRINEHLELWQKAWIKHPLKTENILSLEQLWTVGFEKIAGSSHHIAKEVFEDLSKVGKPYCTEEPPHN